MDEMVIEGPQLKQNGWVCPKCGSSLSPDTKVCPICSGSKVVVYAVSNNSSEANPNMNVKFETELENGEQMIFS